MPYDLPDIEHFMLGLYGDIKTAKTSIALSAPKPLVHYDLDQGFDRAANQYTKYNIEQTHQPIISWLASTPTLPDILTKPYQSPIMFPGGPALGWNELFAVVLEDIGAAYADPRIKTVVVDTGTMMWSIVTNGQLQRAQIRNPSRTRISQIEYARPKAELRALYGSARTYKKSLVITHHVGGIYTDVLTEKGVDQQRTGDTWAGYADMGQIVDMVARSGIDRSGDKPIPMLQIDTSGYTLALEGQVISFPEIQQAIPTLVAMVNTMRKSNL